MPRSEPSPDRKGRMSNNSDETDEGGASRVKAIASTEKKHA